METMHSLLVIAITTTLWSLKSASEWFLSSTPGRLAKAGAASPIFSFLLNSPAVTGTAANRHAEKANAMRDIKASAEGDGFERRSAPQAIRSLGNTTDGHAGAISDG